MAAESRLNLVKRWNDILTRYDTQLVTIRSMKSLCFVEMWSSTESKAEAKDRNYNGISLHPFIVTIIT